MACNAYGKKGLYNIQLFDKENETSFYVMNDEFLTCEFQERQMSFRLDFILEYAALGDKHKEKGYNDIEVYAEVSNTNGRLSKKVY